METSSSVETTYPSTLSYQSLNYGENYKLLRGSFGQILYGLQNMLGRVTTENETDEYKRLLYPELRTLTVDLLERGRELLRVENASDRSVRSSFLLGMNGMVKRNLNGRYPYVRGVNPMTPYRYGNFGDYLKVLSARLSYIQNKNIPSSYSSNQELTQSFNKLKSDVSTMLQYLNTVVVTRWNLAVDNARQTSGVNTGNNIPNNNNKNDFSVVSRRRNTQQNATFKNRQQQRNTQRA